MGRLSNKKKSCLKNLRKGRRVIESINLDSENVTVEDSQPVEIIEETPVQSINSKLMDHGSSKKEPFSRTLMYSARYQRKLKLKNREMAKGSAKISSYFNSVTTSVTEEEPVATELEKIKAAYDSLSLELMPSISFDSILEKSGYERV